MSFITADSYANAGVRTITVKNKDYFWVKMKDIQDKLEYQIRKVKTDNKKDKYTKSDIIEKIIKNCRGIKKCNDGINRMKKENKRQDFRSLLGFKEHDIFKSKERSIIEKIQTVFLAEEILLQHSVFTYRIYIYFPDHKLAVEIDEIGHRNVHYEIQRQNAIEKELNCKFIRINPDKENFNVLKLVN